MSATDERCPAADPGTAPQGGADRARREKTTVRWTLVPANGLARDAALRALMPAIRGVPPAGRRRRSNFAPGEIVERCRVSREKTTVQWTVVPANAQARKAWAGTQATQGQRSAGAQR